MGKKRRDSCTTHKKLRRVHVEPRSIGQRNYMTSISNNKLTICNGPAGCGKTMIAAASALNMMHDNYNIYKHIVIVRPAITACDEKLGYLPGTIESKMQPFAAPILYNIMKMVGQELYSFLVQNGFIKIVPIAYMRGLTLENCIVVFDEAQNSTPEQIKMFLTRIGDKCKIIIEGDIDQSDIKKINGLTDSIDRFQNMEDIGIIHMDKSDIVRSKFVRNILERYEV